jgi:hypothetical protein
MFSLIHLEKDWTIPTMVMREWLVGHESGTHVRLVCFASSQYHGTVCFPCQCMTHQDCKSGTSL